jgi:threonine synthase
MLFAEEQNKKKTVYTEKKLSIEKYRDFLPLDSIDPNFSLGEGQTPLIRLSKVESKLKLPPLMAKVEAANPTLSFKDRGTVVGVQKVRQMGLEKIGTVSTGNMAASTAAYAAKAGMKTIVLIKKGTSALSVLSAAVFNPLMIEVDGDYGQLFYLSYELGRKHGIYFANSIDPLRIEGYKLTSLEICQQLQECPDYLFVPVSSGGHLIGLLKGFIELKNTGYISQVPRIIGVQAEGCSPIARAFAAGDKKVKRFHKVKTIAHSISNPSPPGGDLVLKLIREYGGGMIAVSDKEMLQSQEILCQSEGVFVQPESASTLAAYLRLTERIKGKAVLILTGHGLKASSRPALPGLKRYRVSISNLPKALEKYLK